MLRRHRPRLGPLGTAVALTALAVMALVPTPPAAAASPDIVISEVYGGGGNAGATFKNDFIELYNRGTSSVDLTGWSVQYASAAGTTYQVTNLSGMLNAGQNYLVQEAVGAGGTTALPTPDATGTIAMSATAGKVALRTTSTGCPATCRPDPATKDFVGYGGANESEGAPTATLSNTTSASRTPPTQDTDSNSADFAVGPPAPQSRSAGGSVTPTCPASLGTQQGTPTSAPLTATDSDGTVTAAAITAGGAPGISLTGTTPAGGVGGALSTTLSVAGTTAAGTYIVTITFSNNDPTPQTAGCTVSVSVTSPSGTRIHDIQQATHHSSLTGSSVTGVAGIVTALRTNGYYLQDPAPDANVTTSEGIFVFTSTAPTVAVGDSVLVSGAVAEFRPSGATGADLTSTELTGPTTTVLSSGNALPAPVAIGTGGRVPPTVVIDDDPTASVEDAGHAFDVTKNAIDFYESLEAMRVSIAGGAVLDGSSVTVSNGEIPIVPTGVPVTGTRSPRGALLVGPYPAGNDIELSDPNPERLFLDDEVLKLVGGSMPSANVGDQVGPVSGVLDYTFNNFKLEVTTAPAVTIGPLPREVAAPAVEGGLSIATYNVENLASTEAQSKFDALAGQITGNLRSPDLVIIEEIQDNDGAATASPTDASATYAKLLAAISAAGGPSYDFRQIDPVANQDGGQPNGNIRIGFLFRTDRGLAFVDRPGGTATAATGVVAIAGKPQLTFSPGRIDPTNPAFDASRKPLVGEFTFGGRTIFVVGNHFNSKGGDDPLFGRFQPPGRSSEVQRNQQAQIVNGFVQQIAAIDPNAAIVVAGDLNDFTFSDTLTILKGPNLNNPVLVNMFDTLPADEQYDYVFEGNAQTLDHILVSPALKAAGHATFDVVHVNAEYGDQLSDHDPERLALDFAPPPAVPEAPLVILLPLTAIGLAGAGFVIVRRRRRRTAGLS